MRAAALWVAVACLLGSAATASADIADYLGKRVVTFRVEVEGRETSDPRVLVLVETRPGSPLSLLAVRESVTHLYALGRFEDVRVQANVVSEGVAIVYELVPLHPIRKILFTGALTQPGLDEGRLRKAVMERYGASPPAGRRFDLARVAEDDLKARGFLHAVVTPRLEIAHAPDRATLIFAIEPGARTHIAAIDVTGSPGTTTQQLLDRLGLRIGAPYEREALTTRIQQYQASRRADGYVEASLTVASRFEEGDRVVALTLTAQQGPRVNVVFKGDPIPGGKHDELVPIVGEGSADEDLLEDSSRRIEEYLRGLGYRDAVAPHLREASDGELRITFTITRGPLYRVSDVTLSGNTFQSSAALEPRLGVRKGQPLSETTLAADASMIEDVYRRQGFAAVKVEPSVVPGGGASDAQVPVTVRFEITEGVRTLVNSVRMQGNRSVPAADLQAGLGLQPGRPFFLTQMAVDRDALALQYANRGYQSTTITANPGLSADVARADVMFMINEGPQLIVDHLLIVGNTRTSTATIERELQIKSGDPLGLAAVVDSQRRLAELGLFRRVRITQLPHGDEARRDLVVTVEESPVTTIGYGGGVEALQRVRTTAVEHLEFAPRAFFEIGRRNLFGKNRSVNLFTRVSLRQTDPAGTSGSGFREYRVFGTYREPRLFGTAADAFLNGTVEQQIRSSFTFSRRAFSAEVGRRLTRKVSLSGNYQIQRTELFNVSIANSDCPLGSSLGGCKFQIDRLFPQLLLSSFSLAGVVSTKDDALNPTAGSYFSANGQVAARQIGSEVGFFKSYLTAQVFRTLPRTRRTVLATSVRLGTAYGFPRPVVQTDPGGNPITVVARDLPASERFFAGGDTTVRGFALDQLGTPDTLDTNGFALGGNAVVILNAELRVPVFRSLGVVGFFDAGNVFARTSDIDLGQLRSTVGFGFRYRSPVGPIRVDVGFKTRRREVAPGLRESAAALHFSLGQAF